MPNQELRYEVKLVAPENYLPRLQTLIQLHPQGFSTLYPPRWINNVYFDSQDLSRLNQNYAGVADRSKVRYRWYGALAATKGRLEFKHKSAKLGWKRNFDISREMSLKHLNWLEFLAALQAELPREVWLQMHNLNRPVLINRYHRFYYQNAEGTVRLTLDENQQFFGQWRTERPNLQFQTPPPNELVVELKADERHRERVGNALQGFPLRVSRNSKYVIGTENMSAL